MGVSSNGHVDHTSASKPAGIPFIDDKRRNTIRCLDQHTAPYSKSLEVSASPPRTDTHGRADTGNDNAQMPKLSNALELRLSRTLHPSIYTE